MTDLRMTTRDQTARVANNVLKSLSDVPGLQANATLVGHLYGQDIWAVEVSIENGPTLVYTPWELDNGAEGIKDAYLVRIRQAAGEDIQEKVVVHTAGPRKYFSDMITLDPIDPEDME